MDALSAVESILANTQQQLAMAVIRNAMDSQRQVADMLQQQATPLSSVSPAGSNPAGLGGNVDTYA
jgi:hypothetical protein